VLRGRSTNVEQKAKIIVLLFSKYFKGRRRIGDDLAILEKT
jgi:hypothetical protein